MFNDEEPISFKKMHEFSPADGFVEITENLADMLKFVANEPSVGLFYVQQHTRSSTPNLINLKNNVVEKSHETSLHGEDLDDSVSMVSSMKECGFPIVDDMIRDIKKSLSIISSKKPKKGLIHSNNNNSSSGFLGRTSSWSPASWRRGNNTVHADNDGETSTTGYLSSVFKGKKLPFDLSPPFQSAVDKRVVEIEDLPLSGEIENELREEESRLGKSLSREKLMCLYENYDEFKADQESKLEEWLGRTNNKDVP